MDPIALAGNIARQFRVFECEACALAIRDALVQAGVHGELIEIRARAHYPFVICLSHDRRRAITENGRHLAVRLGKLVVDNLHAEGWPLDDWLADFDAPAGVELYARTPF